MTQLYVPAPPKKVSLICTECWKTMKVKAKDLDQASCKNCNSEMLDLL